MSGKMGLAVYSDTAVSQMDDYQLEDSLEFFSPDVVAVPRPHHEMAIRRAVSDTVPIVVTAGRRRGTAPTYSSGSVDLVYLPERDMLRDVPDLEAEGAIGASGETYLLSGLLSVDIDLVNLQTRLEGLKDYESAFPAEKLSGSYTHLTTEANPDYRNQWNTLTIQGTAPDANQRHGEEQSEIAYLELHSDGVVCSRSIQPSKFGLRSVHQVGQSRASTLKEAGFTSREELAEAEIHELRELSGFGRSTAETVVASAGATVEGDVRRFGDDGFPSAEPVFIDIETDGLNPTMVWLIGVLDRQGDETYMSFLACDPQEPEKAVEAFMSWLTANAPNRPIVAYNGLSFDFQVLEEHVERYCPEYLDDWRDTWTFDPYYWATEENQALLPGRTNKLEDVADALGWESDDTGLTGAAVARLFQRWLANPCEETELDWERHERYCEDDVRALAHVYDAIADASRTERGRSDRNGGSGSATASNTSQGTLGDF